MEPLALNLKMLRGPGFHNWNGDTRHFRPGSKVRIGRDGRCNNIPIKDSGISSKHLSIESESGKWVLRDLDSSNGTLLNGTNVPPNTPLDLSHGDEIKIGECTSIEVKIDGYEESRLRRNPRRVEEIEVKGNQRRGRPPKARVLKSEVAEEKPVEEKLTRQVSVRQTRITKNEELGKIAESSCVDAEGLPKRTRGGARRGKNVPKEQPVCDKLDNEALKAVKLEEERHEEADREFSVGEESGGKGESGSGNGEKVENGSGNRIKGDNGSGSGSGVNVSCDLEKMTLGEWFEFLERHLPKQIIGETEEALAEMTEKAKRIREYIAQEKK
ncbi:hypothetical protein ACFX11_012723 [Malus domestica]